MLVVTREKNQRIVLTLPHTEEEIVINLCDVHLAPNGKVKAKVGIIASPMIKIMREEVYRNPKPITLQSGEVI